MWHGGVQGLLLSSLNLSARCAADARLAPVAAGCMLHACEGAVSEGVPIPPDVIAGLLDTIDACTDPEVTIILPAHRSSSFQGQTARHLA